MSGGSAQLAPLTPPGEQPRLPRTLRLNHRVLLSGLGCALMCPALGVGLWFDDDFSAPPIVLYSGVAFIAMMTLGGIFQVVAWFQEWLRVTYRGFEWHELFRQRELKWCDVQKAVWVPEQGTARVRFFSSAGKLTLFLTQFRPADRPSLVQLIRENILQDRQEGWERIAAMQTKRSGEPVKHGDRGLGIAAALGFIFALILWLAMLGEVPRAWGKFGLMPIIVCPVTFLMSLLDLRRRRTSPWLVAALILSGLGCVFTIMAILHLIRPV
jgi:hypothetical protein